MGCVERLYRDGQLIASSGGEIILAVDLLSQAGEVRRAAEASALLLQPLLRRDPGCGVIAHQRVLRAASCLQDACSHEAALPPDGLEAAKSFLEGAIRCTATTKGSDFSTDPVGAPQLHEALAVVHAKAGNFVMGQRHMLRSSAPASFARMLARWAAHLPPAEGELLLCRACLCTLCVSPQMLGSPGSLHAGTSTAPLVAASPSGVASVRALLDQVGELHRGGAAPSLDPAAPLGHFVQFVLDALERRSPPMLTWLVAQYEARLRDPALRKYSAVVQRRLGLELGLELAATAGVVSMLGGSPLPTPTASHGQTMSTIDDND